METTLSALRPLYHSPIKDISPALLIRKDRTSTRKSRIEWVWSRALKRMIDQSNGLMSLSRTRQNSISFSSIIWGRRVNDWIPSPVISFHQSRDRIEGSRPGSPTETSSTSSVILLFVTLNLSRRTSWISGVRSSLDSSRSHVSCRGTLGPSSSLIVEVSFLKNQGSTC